MGVQTLNNYNDLSRGTFQTDYGKQLISYEGLTFNGRSGHQNVTPTDIDGVVQLDNENCFIFFELKYSGGVPDGQKTALTRLADAIQAGGKNCIVIVAVHGTAYPEKVIAKEATVTDFYLCGKWHKEKKQRKLYEFAQNYISYIKRKQE